MDLIKDEDNKQRQEEMYGCNRRTELTIISD